MAVSFASYEIARSGLWTNERGLTVTGHNISNVNTAGYVRQQAMITTGPYQAEVSRTGMYQLGLGADIQQVRQIRHIFLDNIYRQESTTYGYWEAKSKTFQDVQAILGEPMGAGLQNVMNQFWDSWQELSKEPDSLTVRALVRQRGEAFVHHVNHLGQQLDKLQEDLNSEIRVRIDEINQITEGIASLNVEILKTEVSGDSANDYRDQRNSLVDRLSRLVNADITEMQDGQLAVTLGGYFLVTKGVQTRLYADESQAGGNFLVPKLQGTNIEVPIGSGTLKGLMESRGEVFGAKGSVANGSPYDKVDLVFAIDREISVAQKANIIASATALFDDYKAKGISVNFGITTFDDAGASSLPFPIDNLTDFANEINAITPGAGTTDNNSKGLEAVQASNGFTFRNNAIKHFVLVSDQILDESTLSVDGVTNDLRNSGVNLTVIGDPAAGPGTVREQLEPLAVATGSGYYDINAADYASMTDELYTNMRDVIYNNVFNTQNIISDLRNHLNLLINVMVREVNSLHSGGKTLSNDPGGNFFAAINSAYPMEMGNLKLDDSLSSTLGLNNIVASITGENGDNTVALQIANMRHKPLIGKSGLAVSIDDFYRSIILRVGNDGNDAVRIAENQMKLVQSADNYRQSIAGVSMDEEMSNMMKFKFAYNASSRALNVIDEMMESIITRMGLVGR